MKTKLFKGAFVEPSAEDIKAAECLWIKTIQSDMLDWQHKYKRLGAALWNGMIVVGKRIAKWLKDIWNPEQYILLPIKHPFNKLYMLHLHKVYRGGIEST